MGFISTTTSTALVGYLFGSLSRVLNLIKDEKKKRVLDFKSRGPLFNSLLRWIVYFYISSIYHYTRNSLLAVWSVSTAEDDTCLYTQTQTLNHNGFVSLWEWFILQLILNCIQGLFTNRKMHAKTDFEMIIIKYSILQWKHKLFILSPLFSRIRTPNIFLHKKACNFCAQ